MTRTVSPTLLAPLLGLALCACGQEDAPAGDDPPLGGDAGVACPAAAPTVSVSYPADGAPHTASFIDITGTATNTRTVQVTVDDGPPLTAAGGATWTTTVALGPGPHTITAVGIGAEGCPDGPPVTHTVVQGNTVTLVEPPPGNEIELRLDRLALERLLPIEAQESIILTRLDLRPLVLNALRALEDPVAWGLDTSRWGPAERNLASLLTMSPDSADLDGTDLDPVMRLSAQLGLPPPRILSDMLNKAPTERFLAADIVAQVMIENLIGTHPAFGGQFDGTMPVTLADGLGDLAPLLATYGRSGNHPGFLAAAPSAELFTPSFAMIVRGTGNARILPGLVPGLGFASHVVLPEPGEALLDLDFEDPETFRIVGLHPEPRAALTLDVGELPERYATLAAVPNMPWTLERIIGDASRLAFETLWAGEKYWPYALGAISPAAEVTWNDGWVVVDVVAELGPPPPPAWIWDMILDVAQARLHDGDPGMGPLGEGDANVTLALPYLPIGLTADELIDTMRPILHAQRQTMVDLMVGDPSVLESPATLWLTEGPALRVGSAAPALYPSRAALADGEGGVTELALDGQSRRFWTTSPDGETVALDVGPWQGDHVVIGQTVMPEEM